MIDVSAGLVFRAGQLLITQRRPQDHLGGLWEFPGGKREPDETFEVCLRRELHEELGIEVKVGELVTAVEHTYPEKTVRIHFYRCTLIQGEPQPLGCAACVWITVSELNQYRFPPADEQLLERLGSTPALWSDHG